MVKIVRYLSFFTLILGGYLQPDAHAQEYLWPTEASPYLSSTFGETRSAHFHAGLDIKTWGQEGYRVFASREGIIHRLVMTERGYGRAVYMKHPDGTYTLYAHLQRFNDPLQALADSLRIANKYRAELDIILDADSIRYDKGDVIGYTGSTGIGPPHLHFEIRDRQYRPVNALTSNLSVPDDIPPVFQSIIVEPLNRNSRVNTLPRSDFKRAARQDDGTYSFGTFDISGAVGLAVNVYDQANRVTNSYAVYELLLVHEGDTLYHEKLDGYNYEDGHEMFLNRIAPFGSSRRGHQRVYQKEGAQNPFLLYADKRAEITAADSTATYILIAKDYFGNTSKADITFEASALPAEAGTLNIKPKASEWYWNENWASPDLLNSIDLKNPEIGLTWSDHQKLLYTADSILINLARIRPGQMSVVQTPDHRLKAYFFGDEFHDTLSVALSYHFDDTGKPVLAVAPEEMQSRSDYQLQFFLGDIPQQGRNLNLYRIDPDGDYSFVDSEVRGNTLHAYPGDLGTFTLLSDDEAPSVHNFSIIETDYGKWLGVVRVQDELSGINSKTAVFSINGQRGIADYDYEEELLIFSLPDFSPDQQNSAEISISDKAGNRTVKTFEFNFPASISP